MVAGPTGGSEAKRPKEAATMEIKNGSRNVMMVDAMMVGMILSM